MPLNTRITVIYSAARTLAFIHTYSVLAVGAGIMLSLTVFLKYNDPHAAGSAAGH